MGDFHVRKIKDAEDRRKMYQYALNDIKAFEIMLQNDMFEDGDLWIGAEQELCIVDQHHDPGMSALELLKRINDPHYTNELGLFNMEINLDPLPLQKDCFQKMEMALSELLQKGYSAAAGLDEHILMTGILPTLKYHHLQSEYMTPEERYKTLTETLSEIRGSKFQVYMQGVDDLIMSLGSVLFEACNTSFQLHLQIKPNEFANQHNWAQMIAGPVLSTCVNSPLLFGNELWAETRIALFKQSLDTRSSRKYLRMKLPRVYFGRGWMKESPAELWKNDIMRFPLLVTSDNLTDSLDTLKRGEIPDLRGIRLHNGTTYTWNRMCYGYSKTTPHLRIECRYMPAGPSVIDEIANFAFWIGLMRCEPKGGVDFWKTHSFKDVKNNFVVAARSGLNSVFNWYGKNIPAKNLILEELLPMAEKGLIASGVADDNIKKYLSVIEKRVRKEVTGSSWTIDNFRILSKHYGEAIAQKEIVRQSLEYQQHNIPISEWKNVAVRDYKIAEKTPTVEQLMSTNIYSVHENDSVEIVKSILEWNGIHHLPVENLDGDLVGLITDGTIQRLEASDQLCCFAKDIMIKDIATVQTRDTIEKAKFIFESTGVSGLPVTYRQKLVGMLTLTDVNKVQ